MANTSNAKPDPELSLEYAFVFDRQLDVGDESAGESEKLEQSLFFWPPGTSTFQQIMRISLCTGVLDFCRAFSGTASTDGVQMKDQYYSFYECEKDIWMVWVVSNPRKLEFGGRRGSVISRTEHSTHVFTPQTLLGHLKYIHGLYRLYHGSLRSQIAPNGDLSAMHEIIAMRRRLRKAVEMKEKLDEAAVSRTDANVARAAELPHLQEELKRIEASSPVTQVRKQLRHIVYQFLGEEFTHQWNHHGFLFQSDVTHCPIEKFTYLSVQYFASTVKRGSLHFVFN